MGISPFLAHKWVVLLTLLGIARIFTAYLPNDGLDQAISSFAASPLPRPFSKKFSKSSTYSIAEITITTTNGETISPRRQELFQNKIGHHRRWIPYLTMYRYSKNLSHEMRRQYLRTAFCSPGAFSENLSLKGEVKEVSLDVVTKVQNSSRSDIVKVSCDSA